MGTSFLGAQEIKACYFGDTEIEKSFFGDLFGCETKGTPWDLEGLYCKNQTNLSTIGPYGNYGACAFMIDDGTKFFVGSDDTANHSLYCFNLGTQFDSTTISIDTPNTHNFTDIVRMGQFQFNPSGTKMVVADSDYAGKGIKTYNLSTPFDLSTVSSGNNVTFKQFNSNLDTAPYAHMFSSDGKKAMFICYSNNGIGSPTLIVLSFPTAWDMNNPTHVATFESADVAAACRFDSGQTISQDGTRLFVYDKNKD